MSGARLRAVAAYGGITLTLLSAALVGVLVAASRSRPIELEDISRLYDVGALVAAVAFAAVGAVVLLRAPGNPVGWLFWAMGAVSALNIVAEQYAVYAVLARSHALPGGATAAWIQSWTGGAPVTLGLSLLLLIFPDGRLLGRRWRLAVYAAGVGFVLVFAGALLNPKNTTTAFSSIPNPYGVEALSGIASVVGAVGWFLSLLALLAAAVSLVLRFRRARGPERQQVKWLASAGILVAVAFIVSTLVFNPVTATLSAATGIAIPVSAGMAILRYRLYDVDVVINRTLVYGSVTALLAGTYVGLVLLFQLALRPVTKENGLAIALSTLAVAALFRPARTRIQALVDRRFYRHKYDAERTLHAFSARLRDEVDLDALRAELTSVVAETMQPAHVSLWMRSAR